MPNFRRIGHIAEDLAAEALIRNGLTVVTRRFTTNGGEIDIVALDGETLVFVEVKCRNAPGLAPEETVNAKKLQRIRRAANVYLEQVGGRDRDIRFDMVAVCNGDVRHIPDAFHFG